MPSDFTHLHLHTQYSVLDGAIKISNLVSRLKELGQSSVAMTDHGSMHGAIEFYQKTTQAGIKPILGCEVYITAGSRFEKVPPNQGGPRTHHLTLLAMNKTGYKNLCKLVTLGYTEGFYFKPRIDKELLAEHSEGVICLSGCVSSELSAKARADDIEGAKKLINKYIDMFDDRLYLEIQPHKFELQQKLNKLNIELSKEFNLPLVATNDCHYIHKDDAYSQEVLMCISTGKLITDESRIRHDSELYLKSYDEMLVDFQSTPEALENTQKIAERCDIDFNFSTHYMPQYDPHPEESIDILFEKSVRAGLKKRFKELSHYFDPLSKEVKKEYAERLDEEIGLIHKMGFSGYFLVVSDFIKWAKNNDIPVGPGRGSAAGSLVAYALYITEIDPIRYSLLFERFLNPERVSLPDIDVDFCIYGREKVIEYVYQKYGYDNVAQFITCGTLKAKAAIKDVGRVLGMSYAETDRVAKLIPAPRQGFDYPIAEALKMEKRLAEYARGDGETLINLAQKLEGLSRHTSTHAAGLVISEKPIVEFMPLMLDKEGQIITQFTMNYVEKIGLVKFDFLGLKTLSVIHRAVNLVKQTSNIDVDLNLIPLDDKKVFKLISAGRTIGIFQLESSGITEMVSRMKPNCFEDIVAILALYRPGPLDSGMADHYINRKHGKQKVVFLHPKLEPILKDTYGIILYQEQIMQIARDLANYSLGQADMLRRAMGKKKPEEMAKQREIFLKGALKNKVDEKIATEVFDQMETFARYGFNRSHSVAYAMISYQTAYLKAHYPKEFMAALMSFEMGDTDKILKNLNECKELKIEVLAPDINKGENRFNVADGKIVFGLAALKGVGAKVVSKILEERAENGNFKDFLDFCIRVDSSALNKRSLESFVKSGAFDWTEQSRAELFTYLDENIKIGQKIKQRKESAQIGLFETSNDTVNINPNRIKIPEWPKNIKLTKEREAMGVYLSGHPLERFSKELQLLGARRIDQIENSPDKAQVSLAGIITLLKLKNTKKGDRYASFVLEDTLGTLESLVWPETYRKNIEVINSPDPVVVSGKLDVNEERKVLIVNKIESIISLRDKSANLATIRLDSKLCSNLKLNKLKSILATNQGKCGVMIVIENDGGESKTVISLPENLKIDPSEGLCNQIEQIFGESVLSFS